MGIPMPMFTSQCLYLREHRHRGAYIFTWNWAAGMPIFGDAYIHLTPDHFSAIKYSIFKRLYERCNKRVLTAHLHAESCFLANFLSQCTQNGRPLHGLRIRSRTTLELLPPPLYNMSACLEHKCDVNHMVKPLSVFATANTGGGEGVGTGLADQITV